MVILRRYSSLIDRSCMAPLALAMMVTSGLTCHPKVSSVCLSESYIVFFSLWAAMGNLSWQYVNSMNLMTLGEVDVKGG